MKPKILITIPEGSATQEFLPQFVRDRLEEVGDIEYYNPPEKDFDLDILREKLKEKVAVFTAGGSPKFDERVLAGNDTLKVLVHAGGSVASVVSDYLYDSGIKVMSGNNAFAESVAESVIAYALTALRKIPDYNSLVKGGGWKKGWDEHKNEGLLEQKIGLVDYGSVARHLVRMLKPFRNEILVYSSYITDEEIKQNGMRRATLEEIFSECKIISIHSALTEANIHLVTRELMELIRPDALLINTARGLVIDEEAMTDLLAQNRFRAVLDVFEVEPLPLESRLRSLDNVYLIPHMGGPTFDRYPMVTMGLINDLLHFLDGEKVPSEITKEHFKNMTSHAVAMRGRKA
ncbi:MAG: hydroxyacid dehydrogenase [Ruminococcaceae bacterium]|nr:hydroxyacid dehydrogenase [Oscillospiraceae bacterium]